MTQENADFSRLFKHRSAIQLLLLVVLRVAIGWHFLYEGLSKLYDPYWTAAGYLENSRWIFAGVFKWMASNHYVLAAVDVLNIAGLMLIGFALMVGFMTRTAIVSGILLLFLYYCANPPFLGMDFGVITEGNYLIVDKNLVELLSLVVLAFFPTGRFIGVDRLIIYLREWRKKAPNSVGSGEKKTQLTPPEQVEFDRREILKSLATMPFLGAFVIVVFRKIGWESYEEKQLSTIPDAVTSATIQAFTFSSIDNLQGQVPHAKIKNLDLSRVILGGNLIAGFAHARDLIYVSKLIKAYHNRDKVFETFLLAEKCGINAILTNPNLGGVINDYWKRNIGKIRFISNGSSKDYVTGIKTSIDNGACACYVHGELADKLVSDGKVDEIGKVLYLIKQNGIPAGIGAHSLQTVKECVRAGFEPDFWMKTFHHTEYWSARPGEAGHDNNWCREPDTIEFMKSIRQPWIAFKTLAAGAIHPDIGFRYAFNHGADFICVGMYDFQIVDDVNIALAALSGNLKRERPWMA